LGIVRRSFDPVSDTGQVTERRVQSGSLQGAVEVTVLPRDGLLELLLGKVARAANLVSESRSVVRAIRRAMLAISAPHQFRLCV
jgi:hypothetical protein